MNTTVSYELYVKRNSRWTIESVFVPHERDTAMIIAKRRALAIGVEGVKLVRECYNAVSRLSTEAVVFNSSRAATLQSDGRNIVERRLGQPAYA
jgi:hypothetical protein